MGNRSKTATAKAKRRAAKAAWKAAKAKAASRELRPSSTTLDDCSGDNVQLYRSPRDAKMVPPTRPTAQAIDSRGPACEGNQPRPVLQPPLTGRDHGQLQPIDIAASPRKPLQGPAAAAPPAANVGAADAKPGAAVVDDATCIVLQADAARPTLDCNTAAATTEGNPTAAPSTKLSKVGSLARSVCSKLAALALFQGPALEEARVPALEEPEPEQPFAATIKAACNKAACKARAGLRKLSCGLGGCAAAPQVLM